MQIDNFDKNARTGVTNNGSQKDSLIEYLQDRVKALELEVKTLSIELNYKELAKDDIEVNNDWKHTESDSIE
jgi:hypothetical protein